MVAKKVGKLCIDASNFLHFSQQDLVIPPRMVLAGNHG